MSISVYYEISWDSVTNVTDIIWNVVLFIYLLSSNTIESIKSNFNSSKEENTIMFIYHHVAWRSIHVFYKQLGSAAWD